jgi:hypothetical protein
MCSLFWKKELFLWVNIDVSEGYTVTIIKVSILGIICET